MLQETRSRGYALRSLVEASYESAKAEAVIKGILRTDIIRTDWSNCRLGSRISDSGWRREIANNESLLMNHDLTVSQNNKTHTSQVISGDG